MEDQLTHLNAFPVSEKASSRQLGE